MSDEFDKEAEREKLREKFEKDERKRQATRQMSELLLQGATMTNEHCENCGDPLFRDDGETFCPTCSGAQGSSTSTDEQGQQPAEQSPQQPAEQSPQQPAEQSPQQPAEQPPQQPAGKTQGQPAGQQAPQQPSAEPARDGSEHGDGAQASARVDVSRPEPTTQSGSPADEPRAELQRAVTTTARKATESTDPRTAKAWLEASKEAAEALSALER